MAAKVQHFHLSTKFILNIIVSSRYFLFFHASITRFSFNSINKKYRMRIISLEVKLEQETFLY